MAGHRARLGGCLGGVPQQCFDGLVDVVVVGGPVGDGDPHEPFSPEGGSAEDGDAFGPSGSALYFADNRRGDTLHVDFRLLVEATAT